MSWQNFLDIRATLQASKGQVFLINFKNKGYTDAREFITCFVWAILNTSKHFLKVLKWAYTVNVTSVAGIYGNVMTKNVIIEWQNIFFTSHISHTPSGNGMNLDICDSAYHCRAFRISFQMVCLIHYEFNTNLITFFTYNSLDYLN